MRITKIKVENFAGITSFEDYLTDATFIEGPNRSGKSTVRNAIYWCLTDKLADGSTADGIRPHDPDGTDIDHVEIVVELTVEDGGQEFVVKKTQRQKWTRKRNTDENIFGGNENVYEINGIPKKQKDFTAFIEAIVPADVLLFGMNPMAFLSLDTKKRRAKLLSLETDFTDEDVIATNPDFEELRGLLQVGTVDELLSRSRRAIKEEKLEQTQLPARIDELAKRREASDFDEELKRLEEELANSKKEIEEESAKEKRRHVLQGELVDATSALSLAVSEALQAANAERDKVSAEKSQIEFRILGLKHEVEQAEREIAWAENEKKALSTRRSTTLKNTYEAVSASSFNDEAWQYDPNSETCPTCGRKYEKSQVEKIRANFEAKLAKAKEDFEADKRQNKTAILNEAMEAKAKEAEWEEKIGSLTEEVAKKKEQIEVLEANLRGVLEILDRLPVVTEKPDTEACRNAEERRAAIKAELDNIPQSNLHAVSEKKREIENSIFQIKTKIKNNSDIEKRIAELTQKQKEVAQDIANEERIMDLLQSFDRARVNLLTERVNRHFKIVKFRMFKPLINGGWDSVCEPMVGGSSYFGLLNHGDRILAEIDICMAFQDVAEVKLPIIVDDAESVDPWRIPDIDRQIIVLRRTDNKDGLTVRRGNE